jgi:PAS domain S-box-containing protein
VSSHARHAATDELESFFSVTPDLVCLADIEGRFTRVNPAWTELLGWSSAELTGQPYFAFIHPDDVERTHRAAASLADGETIMRFENRYAAKDGSYRWLSWRAKVDQRTGLIAAIARDVTQRREAEEQLKELNTKLEQATGAKDAFLTRMSHDLRTPLTAVVGFAQLLDSDTLTPDQADSVRQILKAGRHLTQMIDEVLQVVRASAGAVPLSVEPLDIAQVVGDAVDLIRPSAARRRLRVTTAFPTGEHEWALGDRQRTTEIVLNLLSNAVKYNREEGSIHVALTATEAVMRVAVTDTGFGLSPEQTARVFNPFERLDAAQRHIEGTGLGLALAKAMAELMNGTVGVESTVDRGSTFWLELKRTTPPLNRITETVHDAPPGAVADVTGTLLYVDDTPSNLLLIGRLLVRRPGVTLMTAGSGSDGVRLAQTHRPDLILLDFHLPDMDAEEVMRRLSADPTTRGIPVVILTADATRRSGDYVIAGQSVECLSKPIDMPRFVTLIDKLLARPTAG